MIKPFLRLTYGLGLIIPLWLLVGVWLAGYFYPDYNHSQQAMSELGALGAPTYFLSPLLNNYPLGLMFVVFGYAVLKTFPVGWLEKTSACLLMLHGLASIGTGFFPCDAGCNPNSQLTSQLVHNLFGVSMFLSLFLAGCIWVYLSFFRYKQMGFGIFSVACTLLAMVVIPAMGAAVQTGVDFGLYQRINYGASVIWVAGFSVFLLAQSAPKT